MSVAGIVTAWIAVYCLITIVALPSLKTSFYGSSPPSEIARLQRDVGVQATSGPTWIHLGWIADPRRERYRVLRADGQPTQWMPIAEPRLGSALLTGLTPESRYTLRVEAIERATSKPRILGTVSVTTTSRGSPLERPVIASAWRTLFQPRRAGDYVNDHCLFRDGTGRWRLWGITGPGRGDYRREVRFAQGLLEDSTTLETGEMVETRPVADYGEPAWAPHVVRGPDGTYHAYWSPHRAAHAVSTDGVTWKRVHDAIEVPYSWFFRDAMVFEVAPGQWLMYASARHWYFSRIDTYQSFDLDHWQYIGPAWTSSWGSERNAIVGSAESPFVVARKGNYYLSITYNNETGILPPIALVLGHWIGGSDSYNDTFVFPSDNPYWFGEYHGVQGALRPIARLRAHAPEYVYDDVTGRWYVSTAGWPMAATLTRSEVAIARLSWVPAKAEENLRGNQRSTRHR